MIALSAARVPADSPTASRNRILSPRSRATSQAARMPLRNCTLSPGSRGRTAPSTTPETPPPAQRACRGIREDSTRTHGPRLPFRTCLRTDRGKAPSGCASTSTGPTWEPLSQAVVPGSKTTSRNPAGSRRSSTLHRIGSDSARAYTSGNRMDTLSPPSPDPAWATTATRSPHDGGEWEPAALSHSQDRWESRTVSSNFAGYGPACMRQLPFGDIRCVLPRWES